MGLLTMNHPPLLEEPCPALEAGQRALITGAGSGIGKAVATALANQGLRVTLVGRSLGKLQMTRAHVTVLTADLATEDGRALVSERVHPELHVLVHSAGAYLRSSITALSVERWAALDAINLYAPILLTAAVLPQLRAGRGQVVFINSSAGLRAGSGLSAYAAGKHGLRAAADVLRQEVNGYGIRVLSMFLGRTDTPMQQAILAEEQRVAPPGTLMQPTEVAEMVLAALRLPRTAEVTDIMMRPMRPL